MDLGIVNLQLASLVIHPEIKIVKFIRYTHDVKIGTGKIDARGPLTRFKVVMDLSE